MGSVTQNYLVKAETTTTMTNAVNSIAQDDGTTLTLKVPGVTNKSTIEFDNGDNAVISSYYSQVYQVNNSNTQSGRSFTWKTGAKGYGDGTPLMDLLADSANLTLYKGGKIAVYRSDNARAGTFYTDGSATYLESSATGNDPLRLSSPGGSGRIDFYIGGTERVRINSSGNFGIGTTNPSTKLTVTTATQSDGLTVINSLRQITTFQSTGEHCFIYFDSHHDNTYLPILFLQRSSVTYGSVGLNRASNSDALGSYVESEMVVGSSTNTPLSLQSNGVRRIVITGGGNIGVGTTNPGYPFDVRKATNNDVQTLAFFKNTGTTGTSYQSRIIIEGIDANTGLTIGRTATTTAHFSGVAGNFIDTYTASDPLFLATGGTVRMYIASGSGNIGIGTTSPIAKLQVNYSVRVDDGLGGAGSDTYTASSNVYIGSTTGGGALQYNASRGLDLWQFNTSGTWARTTTFTRDGNVGMGTTNPSYKLHVNGTMYSAGSSVMYKENIKSYDTTTDKIMALNPVTYDYKEEYTHLGKTLQSNYQIGLIAEEVAEVFPELAVLTEEEGQKVVRNVDYEKLSVILLTEVQKLRKEINELTK